MSIKITKSQSIALNTFLSEYPNSTYEQILDGILDCDNEVIEIHEFYQTWSREDLCKAIDSLYESVEQLVVEEKDKRWIRSLTKQLMEMDFKDVLTGILMMPKKNISILSSSLNEVVESAWFEKIKD